MLKYRALYALLEPFARVNKASDVLLVVQRVTLQAKELSERTLILQSSRSNLSPASKDRAICSWVSSAMEVACGIRGWTVISVWQACSLSPRLVEASRGNSSSKVG